MIPKDALSGVRVCDLSWIVAAPTATRYMANFGAEVIRVEYAQTLDSLRIGPVSGKIGFDPSPNRGTAFNFWNNSKQGITLNVRHPKGWDILMTLIRISDIIAENYAADVLSNWGLTYDEMKKINPSIIYLKMSGFGAPGSGRNWHYTTWGPTAAANSSLTFMSGLPGMPPAGYGFSYMDHLAGYWGFIAALAALRYRHRTGKGQWIDMSQVEAGIPLTGATIPDYSVNGRVYRRPDYPPGNRSIYPAVAPHNAYRCLPKPIPTVPPTDDRWVVISCFSEAHWKGLCEVMGNPEWTKDPKFADMYRRKQNENELDRNIEAWTKTQKAEDVMWACQGAGLPAGVVQDPQDRADFDPQFKARGFYVELTNPEFGTFRYEGVPFQLSKTPASPRKHAPLVGEWNDQFFLEYLGISQEEYDEFKAEGVVQDMGFPQYRTGG